MLESLASHESTATTVLDMHLYDLLVALWRYVSLHCPYFQRFSKLSSKHFNFDDFRPSLAINVINLLARIARWGDGAEGVVAAKALDYVLSGLHSFNSEIELSTYRLLQALVGHEATVHAVLAIVPLQDIIALTCYGFLCSRYGLHLSSLSAKLMLLA
jgi:hypothetical protein